MRQNMIEALYVIAGLCVACFIIYSQHKLIATLIEQQQSRPTPQVESAKPEVKR